MDGTASRGDSINYARADHVHPSDTSKANIADVLSKTNTTSYTPTGDYNPATKKYVDDSISGFSTTLSGLTDTTISSPTEGQVLSYDSASSKWINTTLSSDTFIVTITSGVSEGTTWYQKNKSFNEITTAYDAGKKCYLTHGIYLYYLTLKNNNKVVFSQVHQDDVTGNVVKSFTINSNNDIAYKATHIYENISELNDVTILSNSLTTGQALIYGGANVGWKNADIATDLVSLTDTTITSPANGQVLSYDSTTSKWINANALTETRVNELIAAALAQYGDGDTASYGYTDASEEEY